MASVAEAFRLGPADNPSVSLVAIETLHALFHVAVVLPDFCLAAMTLSEAICRRKLYFSMGFVTAVARERRHGPHSRNLVTSPALFIRDHLDGLFRKRMALQTGKCLHSDAMNALILVAFLAGLFIRSEAVEAPTVANLARGVQHEYVLGMAV